MSLKRIYIAIALFIGTGVLALIYKLFNPMLYHFYPACPIKHITGLDCPTCGTQRATHLFLNGEFQAAFQQNPLLFILSPYILLWIYLKVIKNPTEKELKIYNLLYGNKGLTVLTVVVLLFTIWRNMK